MKKLLVAFGWLFFAGFASAATLTGVVQDALTNKPLETVSVSVADETAKTNGLGKFELDFTFDPQNPAKIVFSKDAYLDLAGTLLINKKGKLIWDDGTFNEKDLGEITISVEPDGFFEKEGVRIPQTKTVYSPDTFDLETISLEPEPVPIIRGKITLENEGESVVFKKDIKIGVTDNATGKLLLMFKKCKGKTVCEYEIPGNLGTAKNPRNYDLWFHYGDENDNTYKDVETSVSVEEVAKEKVNMVFEEMTTAKKLQGNMEEITGFKCNDTMPRYLVGANCEENKTLEGDATDLAMLMQKFGGKITGMIGMIAVLFIIWNAFKIVAAAGDETKISEAKQAYIYNT